MYNTKRRAVIAPAPHMTPDKIAETEANVTAHFTAMIDPSELKVDNNWYSLIINSSVKEGPKGGPVVNPLEVIIGSVKTKELTESILNSIRSTFTTVDMTTK